MSARVLVVDDSPTIRKVVHAILSNRGYTVIACADGQDALQILTHQLVDLILLDFVMPNMNGFQFCRALRVIETAREVPVILMSAKADRIRDRFIEQTGAVDAITKPFDPTALLAFVGSALKRLTQRRKQDDSAADGVPDSHNDEPPPSVLTPSKLTPHAEIAHALAYAVQSEIHSDASAADDDSHHSTRISSIIESALRSKDMLPLLQRLRWSLAASSDDALFGDLATIPVSEVMQLLQMQRQTGILEIADRNVIVLIHLRHGLVNLAQCINGSPELLLGRYFLRKGRISRSVLENAAAEAKRKGELLGTLLVAMGHISQEDLRSALIQQTSEIIYEALRWKRGSFLLRRNAQRAEAENAALALPIAAIVMEGFRRVDEWRVIEQTIQFDEVLLRNDSAIVNLPLNHLSQQDYRVLAEIDGTRRVRDIIEQSNMSTFDICSTLCHLIGSQLAHPKRTAGPNQPRQ